MKCNVQFREGLQNDISLHSSNQRFSLGLGEVQAVTVVDVPPYEGDYMVIPSAVEQTLTTREKRMLDDVIVKSIPFVETSNDSGTTVYIG